jgi:hypothetical protein
MNYIKTFTYSPKLDQQEHEKFIEFCKLLVENLIGKSEDEKYEELRKIKSRHLFSNSAVRTNEEISLLLAQSLLLDLLLQDWQIDIDDEKIKLSYYELNEKEPELEKKKIRRRQLVNRNEQLQETSVKAFIKSMEKRKLMKTGWYSVFSLMRDGDKLKNDLIQIHCLESKEEKLNALNRIIKPYLQIVEPDVKCDQTGMLLTDIWRYFRHTWVNEYQTMPGRSMQILIRDAAVVGHPIIGIASLGSSVAQQTVRDNYIGWNPDVFLKDLETNPTKEKVKWIFDTINNLLQSIYIEDLIGDLNISKDLLSNPNREIIKELELKSITYKKEHIQFPSKAKKVKTNTKDWHDLTQLPLFRSKRAQQLADILSIRLALIECDFNEGTLLELQNAIRKSDFRDALRKLIRRAKAQRVGIDIMDIMVCGAVAPYSHLLGGKLVCMMLCSPELISAYENKYEKQESIIASSMKGSSVVRKPNLAFLGTTSLYGVGSSQYNRVKIPASITLNSKNESIKYIKLGVSEGFGSFHLSTTTKEIAYTLLGRLNENQKVNFIFGEGANPKMRKLNEAFTVLGLIGENILKHNNYRVVYGVPLIENLSEFLIGYDKKPKYIMATKWKNKGTEKIAQYWIERWLLKRIENVDVLEKVGKERITYPITHGARVPLIENDSELNLFSGLLDEEY